MDWLPPMLTTTAKSKSSCIKWMGLTEPVAILHRPILHQEKPSLSILQTSPSVGASQSSLTSCNTCFTMLWTRMRTCGSTKAMRMLPFTSALVPIPPSPDTSMRGQEVLNSRFDGGINVSQITVRATCSPCTSPNIWVEGLLSANWCRTLPPVDWAWKISPFHLKPVRSDFWEEQWAKFMPISASLQHWIRIREFTDTPA